jgi:hypothetical protein
MAEENLTPRVSNLETLVEYIVQTQRQLATNQDLLTSMLQLQEQRIQLLEESNRRSEETIAVMQGQIRLLLERLLGNT